MTRQLLPISALLLGSAFLLFAGGINGLILPVRGTLEGFSTLSLGLLGTGWAVGYIAGCYFSPRLVARVGHVRAFSVLSSAAAIALLMSLVLMDAAAWIVLRAISGFCFAGAAMIVESWLSDRAGPSSRGRIFGIYTMVNLVAVTGGQLSLTLGDTTGFLFFALGAVFYCLALIPTAVSSSETPAPLVNVRIDLGSLWRLSPVALFGVFFVGIANSAFGTLSAVYSNAVGLDLTAIALFASIPILAGAVSQVPIGYLSDRFDRRGVLAGIAALAIVADILFLAVAPVSAAANLAFVALFGAMVFAMYPVILAHANDHAAPGQAIQVSGGLLMVYGMGSIIGPLVAGIGMASVGPSGLFATSLVAHVVLLVFTLWRMRVRAPVPDADKSAFIFTPPARTATPETSVLVHGQDGADTPEKDPRDGPI